MHKVEINKKEGNELVKDQNWSQGVARYTNALQHCSKFYDLSPEQMEELKAVKLSLYNNIAMCANKMEDWKVTKENCNKALEIDASNVKALFRRAAAFEKCKQYEEALADLATAASHAPEDKNVIKAVARVKKLQKKQEDKEKKMCDHSRLYFVHEGCVVLCAALPDVLLSCMCAPGTERCLVRTITLRRWQTTSNECVYALSCP